MGHMVEDELGLVVTSTDFVFSLPPFSLSLQVGRSGRLALYSPSQQTAWFEDYGEQPPGTLQSSIFKPQVLIRFNQT